MRMSLFPIVMKQHLRLSGRTENSGGAGTNGSLVRSVLCYPLNDPRLEGEGFAGCRLKAVSQDWPFGVPPGTR